ncbi:MAG TPA: hypothetical protein VFF04_00475 [Candidatus Babeliales bacterium]|nr:hypothetical protein [Candidatus Babeliales bacterium]
MKIQIAILACMLNYPYIFTMHQVALNATIVVPVYLFPVFYVGAPIAQPVLPPANLVPPPQSDTVGLSVRSEYKDEKSDYQPKVTETRVNGYREFCCSECSQSFSTKFSAERHLKTHTGAKPFHCLVPGCTRQFAEKSVLDRHMVAHNKEKPFGCICDKWYADRQNALKHIKQCSNALEADLSKPLVRKIEGKA